MYSFRVHLLTDSLLHLSGVLRNVYSLGPIQSHLSNACTAHAHTHRHGSLLLGFFFWPVFTATLTISLLVERRYLPPQ